MKDAILMLLAVLVLGSFFTSPPPYKGFHPGWIESTYENPAGGKDIPLLINMGHISVVEPFGKKGRRGGPKQTKVFFVGPSLDFLIINTPYDDTLDEIRKSAPSVMGSDPRNSGGGSGGGGIGLDGSSPGSSPVGGKK